MSNVEVLKKVDERGTILETIKKNKLVRILAAKRLYTEGFN